ncbi:MAG: alpha/beta hydrolase fold domain-containing protein [Planctomycetota bacterium]
MRQLLFATFVLTACSVAVAQRNYPPKFEGARAMTYKKVDDVELKVWVFEPEGAPTSDKRPAIVFFFGGGWNSGSPAQFEQHCRYLAKQGMVAMTADYRVKSRHKTLADSCVSDAETAIQWIRTNAEKLGVDPDRIVAGGGSAGGHLAACTGVVPPVGVEENDPVSSRPNALALFNPAVVLAPFDGINADKKKLAGLKTRTGVEPKALSPIHHVKKGLPPTIIFHGTADSTVPFVTVKRYTEVATAAGNRCELMAYDGEGHGFFNYGRGGKPGKSYLKTVHQLHKFLQSLGYLEQDPPFQVPLSSNVNIRSDLNASRDSFADGKGTVAFMGGSITENPGYRSIVQAYLSKRYPKTEFKFIAAGISSTCSTTGAFRLSRDVLAHDPDLFFVEFAVNDDQDAAHAKRDCIRGMEGIIRQAKLRKPSIDIVVTHFVNPPILEELQKGKKPISLTAHERVASHYGVASINLAQEVADQIERGTITWKQYGGTHPKPAGYQVAGALMVDLLDTAWAMPDAETASDGALPEPIDTHSFFRGRFLDLESLETGSAWAYEKPSWKSIPGSLRKRFEDKTLLHCDVPGSTLELPFAGSAIGLYVLAGPDAGKIEASIDGGEFKTIDLYHRFSRGLHYPRTVMLATELNPGEHDVTLRVSKDHHPESNGNAIRILQVTAN